MKKKFVLIFAVILASALIFAACGSKTAGSYDNASAPGYAPGYDGETGSGGDSGGKTEDISGTGAYAAVPSDKKILYSARLTLVGADIGAAAQFVKSKIEADEWFDSEQISGDSASFTARIKSARIDAFVDALKDGGTVHDYSKTATDISTDYYDKQGRIDALNAEHARLVALYATASVTEMIAINTRISQVEYEIQRLTSSLGAYDSLLDYSTVYISVSKTYVPAAGLSYGERVKAVFTGAWKALGEAFKWLGIILLAVLPFALAIGIPTVTVIIIRKKRAKRANAETKPEPPKSAE